MIKAHLVQFLSRDCIDDSFHGGRHYNKGELKDHRFNDFQITMEIQKGGLKHPPAFAEPWPKNPDAGAFQFVDPAYKERWPIYLYLTAQIEDNNHETSIDRGRNLLHALKLICWSSFQSMPDLAAQTDQCISHAGYRWMYMSPVCDFNSNPLSDPDGDYLHTSTGTPIGPGFATLNNYKTLWTDQSFNDLNLVWSQSISLERSTNAETDQQRINEKALKLKNKWNSYDELRQAKNYSENYDTKGVIRSSASAVDSALRFYCTEWGVSFPKSRDSFDNKIREILIKSKRPPYMDINGTESLNILHLYRARSSMHEGECYYTDSETNKKTILQIYEAREFMVSAEKFVLWLDSQA